MSYAVLLQENIILTLGFIKDLWWPSMPSILFDSTTPLWILVPLLIIFPMCCKKRLADSRFLAMFGFCVIIYLTGVIIGYSLLPSNNPIDENFEKIKVVEWKGITTTFSLFLFGYTCQPNVLDAYNELNDRNVRRMKKVITRQFLIVTACYMLIGVFGYFNWPVLTDAMTGNILTFYDPMTHFAALIGVVLLSISIMSAMPLVFKPTKDAVHRFIYPSDNNIENNWIHYPLCIILQVIVILICSICVKYHIGMDKMLSYVSGSTSPLMC